MSKQTKEERIEILKATQEARKQETLAKVNQAIERLVRTGAKISFAAVAREANVIQQLEEDNKELRRKGDGDV